MSMCGYMLVPYGTIGFNYAAVNLVRPLYISPSMMILLVSRTLFDH